MRDKYKKEDKKNNKKQFEWISSEVMAGVEEIISRLWNLSHRAEGRRGDSLPEARSMGDKIKSCSGIK